MPLIRCPRGKKDRFFGKPQNDRGARLGMTKQCKARMIKQCHPERSEGSEKSKIKFFYRGSHYEKI
jgi:hypothetical protein